MLVFPELVLEGQVPNRDFLHLYGPGSLWLLAGAYELFGVSLATERVMGLVQHLGVIFGLFALALPWGRRIATAVGLVAVLITLFPVGLAAMAWNGAIALAVAGLAVASRGLCPRGPPTAEPEPPCEGFCSAASSPAWPSSSGLT